MIRNTIKFLLGMALMAGITHAGPNVQGWCTPGGTNIITSGIQSQNLGLGIFPFCQVKVYVSGSGGSQLATLFKDDLGTPLTNPFIANQNGSWQFFTQPGFYDVTIQGGGLPLAYTFPDLQAQGSAGFNQIIEVNGTALTPRTNLNLVAGAGSNLTLIPADNGTNTTTITLQANLLWGHILGNIIDQTDLVNYINVNGGLKGPSLSVGAIPKVISTGVLGNSSLVESQVVQNSGGSVNCNLPVFFGTSGTQITDSGVNCSQLAKTNIPAGHGVLNALVSVADGSGSIFGETPILYTDVVTGTSAVNFGDIPFFTSTTGRQLGTSLIPYLDVARNSFQCQNVLNFAGSNPTLVTQLRTGQINAFPYYQAALSAGLAIKANQTCVYFPAGDYNWTQAPTFTMPVGLSSLTIEGDGTNVTRHFFPSGIEGFTFFSSNTNSTVHIHDMTFLTEGTTDSGLVLHNNDTNLSEGGNTDLYNLNFGGADCLACSDYWQNAIYIDGWIKVNMSNIHIVGAPNSGAPLGQGIVLLTSTPRAQIVYNIFGGTNIDYVNIGLYIGDWTQGITVAQNNFTGVGTGIFAPAGSTHGLDELLVWGNQFNAINNGINIASIFNHVQIQNNYLIVPANANGVIISPTYTYTVSGNSILGQGTGNNGVVIGPPGTGGAGGIFDNQLWALGTGIFLQSGSTNATVGNQVYISNTTNLADSGSGNIVGVTCSGTPTSAFASSNGLITHC